MFSVELAACFKVLSGAVAPLSLNLSTAAKHYISIHSFIKTKKYKFKTPSTKNRGKKVSYTLRKNKGCRIFEKL